MQYETPVDAKPEPITVAEMCAAMPRVFCLGAKARPPSQTIYQWQRTQWA